MGRLESTLPAYCLALACVLWVGFQGLSFTVPREAGVTQGQQTAASYGASKTTTSLSSQSFASTVPISAVLLAAAFVGCRVSCKRPAESQRGSGRQAVALKAGHALIMQNKGGGHGEIGYHLALALQAKGMKVTMLQDSAAKKSKVPYNMYDSKLSDATITWIDPEDIVAYSSAAMASLSSGSPVTHIFDNYSKKPAQIEPLLNVAKASPDFKLYSFVSSAGMYTAKGELKETLAVKDPPTGQREVEMRLAQELPGKWASFRPQYIYGPLTNKRSYLDWFLSRAVRGLPLPVPGDASQPVNVAHCEDVAALLSGVVGREAAAGGEAFNCGTSSQVTYRQLCEAAGKAVGKSAKVVSLPAGTKTSFPFRPNAEGFYVNVDKAKAILGFTAKHDVLSDIAASGFYTQDFKSLGFDQGDLDTSKDLPEGMAMPAVESADGEELAFTEGQCVIMMSPPAMAGKQGTVLGPVNGEDAFKVRLDSGSVFNFATDSLLDANEGSKFQQGQRVQIMAPAALQGKVGTVVGPQPSRSAVTVRFDGSSVKYLVLTKDLQSSSATGTAASAPAAVAAPLATGEEELAFSEGQLVVLLGPPAMAGQQGTVMGPALGDSFAVRFESGSIFNIATENLQDASAPVAASAPAASTAAPVAAPAAASGSSGTASEEELEFEPGQRVLLTGPPALAGKQGSVIGPILGDSFAVRFDSGSVFNITTANLRDAAAPAPSPASTSAPSSSPAAFEEELEFQPGQRVVCLMPPAMAGKQGTIVGPALGDAFSVRFDSGSIFNIATENLHDAAAIPTQQSSSPVAAPPAPSRSTPASADEEPEFTEGQRVIILGPPAMAGKQGTVVGPAGSGEAAFSVQLESGSVFNIPTDQLESALVRA